jgi:hypothetical protein
VRQSRANFADHLGYRPGRSVETPPVLVA